MKHGDCLVELCVKVKYYKRLVLRRFLKMILENQTGINSDFKNLSPLDPFKPKENPEDGQWRLCISLSPSRLTPQHWEVASSAQGGRQGERVQWVEKAV
jgi:hypothetical protein